MRPPYAQPTSTRSVLGLFQGQEADIRTDIGLYRIYKNGKLVSEEKDISKYWNDQR